jgi:hypothetical protein
MHNPIINIVPSLQCKLFTFTKLLLASETEASFPFDPV